MKRIISDTVECFGISCIHHVKYDDGTNKTFVGNTRIPASVKRFLRSARFAEDGEYNGSSITVYVEGE